jgi:hypothetical protein
VRLKQILKSIGEIMNLNDYEPTVDECHHYLKGTCLFNGKNCNTPRNKMEQCQNGKNKKTTKE